MDEGTIASWYKQEGDKVAKGEPLCGVETDKAVIDVEATRAGYLVKIAAPAGSTLPVLQVIAYIGDSPQEVVGAAVTDPAVIHESSAAPAAPTSSVSTEAPEDAEPADGGRPVFVTPSARRVARDHGIDAKSLAGTGPGGRVVEADVLKEIESRRARNAAAKPPPMTAEPRPASAPLAPAATDEYQLLPISKIRRIIADKLSRSYREAVHVTLDCEVDMAEATKLRSQLVGEWEPKLGVKITYTDLLVRAVAKALTEHRNLNATYTDEGIRAYSHVNVGVAMAIPAGLVVPVVRDADAQPLIEIASTVRKLTEKARAGQIGPDEMRGGTFTVTNMGTMGIDHFTPIINGGEGAILGVGQIAEKPVVRDGMGQGRRPSSRGFVRSSRIRI
jgi:pyruvate dehydrogenase E2 component (dihydrolipoamide acetyltransferase)